VRNFKYSLSNAKRGFYIAVNGIFSKVLNLGSEEVILELITTFVQESFCPSNVCPGK